MSMSPTQNVGVPTHDKSTAAQFLKILDTGTDKHTFAFISDDKTQVWMGGRCSQLLAGGVSNTRPDGVAS
jgi:hypothetical protein